MELFEEIRREYEHGVGTIKGIARKLGVHRRMVREALASAVPPPRKIPVRKKPKLEPAIPFIKAILEADQKAPRKQRHTAHRIWRRLCNEMPELKISETTVRKFVRKRKLEMGLTGRAIFIPQSYRFGEEAQVDWYEAYVDLDGERQKVNLFCMRSMASGGAFHRAYPHASQQAFLDSAMLRHFTLEYWTDDGWYVGRLKEILGVFSQGKTMDELEENIKDAYQLMMADEETTPHPRCTH